MGEGHNGFFQPDSGLRTLFGGMDACQQAVGVERVSDIGVYYDSYREMAEKNFGWLREASEKK